LAEPPHSHGRPLRSVVHMRTHAVRIITSAFFRSSPASPRWRCWAGYVPARSPD
jgi:hypothetical protein